MKPNNVKCLAISIGIAAVGAMELWSLWSVFFDSRGPGQWLVRGNGRVEATEIDVASKLAGRIEEILVAEGEFVDRGQTLVQRNVDVLKAQREEAIAQSKQASAAVVSAIGPHVRRHRAIR